MFHQPIIPQCKNHSGISRIIIVTTQTLIYGNPELVWLGYFPMTNRDSISSGTLRPVSAAKTPLQLSKQDISVEDVAVHLLFPKLFTQTIVLLSTPPLCAQQSRWTLIVHGENSNFICVTSIAISHIGCLKCDLPKVGEKFITFLRIALSTVTILSWFFSDHKKPSNNRSIFRVPRSKLLLKQKWSCERIFFPITFGTDLWGIQKNGWPQMRALLSNSKVIRFSCHIGFPLIIQSVECALTMHWELYDSFQVWDSSEQMTLLATARYLVLTNQL